MWRLRGFLKDYKKECVLAPLFKMLEATLELLVPIVVAAMIDRGIKGQNKGYLYEMSGVLILLGIVGLAFSITAQYFSAKAAVGFATKLRHSLFKHLQGLSFSEMDTIGTSTMITRMTSDVNQAQTGVNMVLRLILRAPFVVFGAMIMAFTINKKAAMNFVWAISLLSLVIFVIMAVSIPMLKKVQRCLDSVLSTTRENLTGVRVIRAFCKEQEEIKKFRRENEQLTRQQKRAGSISALMNPLTYIIVNLFIIRLIQTGAVEVSLGTLTQGQVVALYNYMSQILVELIKLANLIITVNKAAACGKRLSDVFAISSSMTYKNETIEITDSPAIEFDHVSLTYQNGGEEALTDLSFSVKRGETVGIIGGTGSGKSSVVHLIPRFYDASKGTVLVNGVDVKKYDKETITNLVGIVLQKAVLFQGTIEENLRWGNKTATSEELMEAIELAQAKDFVCEKGGLLAKISQGGKNLSGGQKQRLSIARALVKRPEILILDDSASALDMATDARLRKAIRTLSYRPTVIIVSQRTAAIQDADHIIVLNDGEMEAMGTHETLLSQCKLYREIYESQYKKEGAAV